jgi:uncharacterized membrane protein
MEDLFTFLFKYPPFFFRKGELTFQWALNYWQLSGVVLLISALLTLIYLRRANPRFRPAAARTLLTVRACFVLLLMLILMRPSLVLSSLVPKENLLAILVDNSASMGIEEAGESRGHPLVDLVSRDSDFLAALDEKFYLRFFRFDSHAKRVERPFELDWKGDQTNIAAGLERILSETKNLPLGGILLFSDGSDNSYEDIQEVLNELKAHRIPVHTVGLGPEVLHRDVEMTQVSAPRSSIPGTISVARITFRQYGFGGARGRLRVREGNSLIQTQEVYFPRDSESLSVEVKFIPKEQGVKTYHFNLEPLEGEQIQENNSRRAVIQVQNLAARILYVEGRPRWEYKFIRRALVDDEHIQLETLLRTALNKFYRQGIQTETTLATGFPARRQDLFDYDGVIFGSLESSFFTYAQMEMVHDFVSKRGGGFLMLGGSSSFASGQYQNTPIEEILPVWLQPKDGTDPISSEPPYHQTPGRLRLTERGRHHPALQLSLEEANNAVQWDEVPELTDWNSVQGTKPGAIVLAHLASPTAGSDQPDIPLLIFQRYGRGQSFALLTGSSWRWQMLQDQENQNHQTFWRQILRWLVSSAKKPVTVETERESYARNEVVRIRAEINDRAFNRINDARVQASLTTPSGEVFELPLQWDSREDGVYRGQWTTHEDGLHLLRIQAEGNTLSEDQGQTDAQTFFLTSTGTREYFEAVQKRDFLQKVAQETGGSYYPLEKVDQLPHEILYTESHTSVIEILDLWDMPFNFFVLMALLVSEWMVRRRHGQV